MSRLSLLLPLCLVLLLALTGCQGEELYQAQVNNEQAQANSRNAQASMANAQATASIIGANAQATRTVAEAEEAKARGNAANAQALVFQTEANKNTAMAWSLWALAAVAVVTAFWYIIIGTLRAMRQTSREHQQNMLEGVYPALISAPREVWECIRYGLQFETEQLMGLPQPDGTWMVVAQQRGKQPDIRVFRTEQLLLMAPQGGQGGQITRSF